MARRQLARVLDRDAVGDRVAELRAAGERCARGRLHADDADVRPERAQRERDPGGEPAAADRDDDRLEPRDLLGELEADRPLAGDHVVVLEGVDERRAGLLDVGDRGGDRVLEASPPVSSTRAP